MSDTQRIRLVVNGRQHEREVPPRRLLVDFLRHDLGLHGTHVGCEQGVCGMCTILLDGEPIKSCLLLALQADGHDITTVESLAQGDALHPVQEAFRDEHGLQCGYCTPAFLLLVLALKKHGLSPSREELREDLAGTLCRCTGYQNILTAAERFLVSEASSSSDRSSEELT
jgi:carbon-monoxide dehydrogenase small subunit